MLFIHRQPDSCSFYLAGRSSFINRNWLVFVSNSPGMGEEMEKKKNPTKKSRDLAVTLAHRACMIRRILLYARAIVA